MYVIVVYDVNVDRVSKMNRYLKRYLMWVQNSVFEGEISDSLLNELLKGLKSIVKENDSVTIYRFRAKLYLDRLTVGVEKGSTDNII